MQFNTVHQNSALTIFLNATFNLDLFLSLLFFFEGFHHFLWVLLYILFLIPFQLALRIHTFCILISPKHFIIFDYFTFFGSHHFIPFYFNEQSQSFSHPSIKIHLSIFIFIFTQMNLHQTNTK